MIDTIAERKRTRRTLERRNVARTRKYRYVGLQGLKPYWLSEFLSKKTRIWQKSPFFATFEPILGIVIHLSTELSTLQKILVDKVFHIVYETDKH